MQLMACEIFSEKESQKNWGSIEYFTIFQDIVKYHLVLT